ncbi:MAG: radical SAM protein [Acidobacteria bacterium]|jgi:radical SAM protein with 4Fe4S-binding SPASM domain|nr:radical SAM protein [Acidobacteriota bacterium]
MAVGLYITERCLQNCRFCFNWKVNGKQDAIDMDFHDITHILNESKQMGHSYLTITGGEPFLHPNITDIIDYAHDLGFMINILTNGLLINEELIAKLRGKFRLRIRVSLDGASKEVHEYARGKDTFDRVLTAILLLIKNNFPVGIGLTLYDENINEIEDIIRLSIDMGCSYIRFSPVIRIQKGKQAPINLNLHETALIRIIEAQLKYREYIDLQGPTGENFLLPVETITTKRCEAGVNFFAINPDKVILPCPLIRPHPSIFRKTFTGKDDFQQVRFHMDELFGNIRANLKGLCASCGFNERCCGGCPAEKISFDLDLYDEQPVCLNRLLKTAEKKFNAGDFRLLINNWFHRLHHSFECDNDISAFCFRQAPFWTVIFKRTTGNIQ